MATKTIYPFGQSAPIGGAGYILVPAPSSSALPPNSLPAPDASTKGPIYLVPQYGNTDTKDMYVTVLQNGNYVWTKIGSTDVDLTGYATEDWVKDRDVDLTIPEYEALVAAGQVDPEKKYFVDEAQQ